MLSPLSEEQRPHDKETEESMTNPENAPREPRDRRSSADDDLVTGMGGADDPIVDGIKVESDLEENPYSSMNPSGSASRGDVRAEERGRRDTPSDDQAEEPDDLDFNELDPNAKDRTWGA